nr:E3 ubiquitin-protein ligase lubel-like [Dermatophagoides farinae]
MSTPNSSSSSSSSAFRPLPQTPATDELYANMRKHSLQPQQKQQQQQQPPVNIRMLKTRQFATTSTIDLSNSGNGHNHHVEKLTKRSSLPRKNFSYQDLEFFGGENQQQESSIFSCNHHHHHSHHGGSTQSLYPSCPMNHCSPSSIQCNHCSYHQPNLCYGCNSCCNHRWSTNSMEELRRNSNHHDVDDDNDDDGDFETDDEDDMMIMRMVNNDDGRLSSIGLSRETKNRIRRARMKRSQSTYTMYGVGNHNYDDDEQQQQQFPTDLRHNKIGYSNRSPSIIRANKFPTSSSPTPSLKSVKSFSDRYRYSDSISDSSSSSQSRNKVNPIAKTNIDAKISPNDDEEEELVTESGQWSCRFCTFVNDSGRNVCEICCKTRISSNSEQIHSNKQKVSLVMNEKTTNSSTTETEIQKQRDHQQPPPPPPTKTQEQEIIFDESFVREQIEIEKELQKRKENELKVVEENKKLEINDQDLSASKKSNEKESTNTNQSIAADDNECKELDNHEKIVAKMIEEKISEQFGKLKLTPPAATVPVDNNQNVTPINNSTTTMAMMNVPISNANPCTASMMIPPNFSQNNSIQNNPQQFYPLNNQWSNNSTPLPNFNMNNGGGFIHPRTPSSSSSNSTASMFGYNGLNNYPQPIINPMMVMDHPQSSFNHHQQNPDSCSQISMNRFSSFDDLQSLSSVTSSSLFYPDSNLCCTTQQKQQQHKSMINSSRQMIQTLREAEKKGYTADDLEAAIQFSPVSPLEWLEKNWKNLCETVMTMSNNQIVELERTNGNKMPNFIMITEKDAKTALRLCKGNLWQSIEKCVQRHRENKLFNNDTANNNNVINKNLPSKSEFFAMKVTGLGSGRANNDANHVLIDNEDNDDGNEFQKSFANETQEFNYSEHSKLPMEEFLASQESMMDRNELLDFYLQNIKNSKNLDYNELETLIMNWQQEKASFDRERQQSRIREKEREKMQKIIDVQKRISGGSGGGYLSDGTTTEEELDREVARVFQNRRLSQSMMETIDSDRTPTFTQEMDLFTMSSPGTSGTQNIRPQSQIKQRIESKLNEFAAKHSGTATTLSSRTNSIISTNDDENITTPIQQLQQQVELSPISISDNSDENFIDAVAEIVESSTSPSSSAKSTEKIVNTPKPLKAQIVVDEIFNFMAKTQQLSNVCEKHQTGIAVVKIAPAKALDQIITTNQNDLKIISSVKHTNACVPMSTGEPMVIKPPPPVTKSNPVETTTSSLSIKQPITGPSSSLSLIGKSPVDDQYSYEFQWARTELECELCTTIMPIQDIVVMIACTHYACRDCMKNYLTIQIRERQRLVITCPFCNEPDISADQDEQVFEYLAIFDPFIRHIIDADIYELFQRKMRDRALMRDPNFMWCVKCSSGFIVPNPKALTVICPDCRNAFCRQCKKQWKNQHLNLSCEQFARWENEHDIDYAEQLLNKHLEEFGIECPNCHFRYQLAKGGCMHFRCTQCSFDFCGGCYRPFKLGSRCFRAKLCERLGLHAHHPRNCLFYLRDKDIGDLQKLLDQNNIEYKTNDGDVDHGANNNNNNNKTTTMTISISRCQVMEQKEVNFVMKDKPCNRFVEMAGLCKLHYKEYLGNLIYRNQIDPIPILTESELELTLKRENIRIPSKIRGEDYIEKLKELIREKIPLESK